MRYLYCHVEEPSMAVILSILLPSLVEECAYHGHFPKIEVARNISPCMTFNANQSASFQAFCKGVEALLV